MSMLLCQDPEGPFPFSLIPNRPGRGRGRVFVTCVKVTVRQYVETEIDFDSEAVFSFVCTTGTRGLSELYWHETKILTKREKCLYF